MSFQKITFLMSQRNLTYEFLLIHRKKLKRLVIVQNFYLELGGVFMKIVDKKIYEILNEEEKLEEYLNSLNYNDNRRNKTYQVVIFKELELGFIIERQYKIIGIFENKNPRLGKLISESEIGLDWVGGKRVEMYGVIDIRFPGIIKNVPSNHRNLGKIFLMSNGIIIKNGYEAHHIFHAIINTSDTVISISKSLNLRIEPKLNTYVQAIEYIKNNILKTNDVGFERFMYNIKFVTTRYIKHRGVYLNKINPTEMWINGSMTDKIELSRL